MKILNRTILLLLCIITIQACKKDKNNLTGLPLNKITGLTSKIPGSATNSSDVHFVYNANNQLTEILNLTFLTAPAIKTYNYTDNRVTSITGTANLKEIVYNDKNKIARIEVKWPDGSKTIQSARNYIYTNNRLARIDCYRYQTNGVSEHFLVYTLEYDAEGLISRIRAENLINIIAPYYYTITWHPERINIDPWMYENLLGDILPFDIGVWTQAMRLPAHIRMDAYLNVYDDYNYTYTLQDHLLTGFEVKSDYHYQGGGHSNAITYKLTH